jgi:hypothetical protein
MGMDSGLGREPLMQWVIAECYWIVRVVLRPEAAKSCALLKKRWVVQRTFDKEILILSGSSTLQE